MENKYLNEENYQKTKKKLIIISLIILVLGISIGSILIGTGIIKTQEIKEENSQTAEESKNIRTSTEIQNDIDTTQTNIDTLKDEITNLKVQLNKICTANGFSNEYYEIQAQII